MSLISTGSISLDSTFKTLTGPLIDNREHLRPDEVERNGASCVLDTKMDKGMHVVEGYVSCFMTM
jgi:hypothetical protein